MNTHFWSLASSILFFKYGIISTQVLTDKNCSCVKSNMKQTLNFKLLCRKPKRKFDTCNTIHVQKIKHIALHRWPGKFSVPVLSSSPVSARLLKRTIIIWRIEKKKWGIRIYWVLVIGGECCTYVYCKIHSKFDFFFFAQFVIIFANIWKCQVSFVPYPPFSGIFEVLLRLVISRYCKSFLNSEIE